MDIPLGFCTVTRTLLYCNISLDTEQLRGEKTKRFADERIVWGWGPPNWDPSSTHMPHKCDLWTRTGAQHTGPQCRLKLKLPCCCSVRMKKTTGWGTRPGTDTYENFSIQTYLHYKAPSCESLYLWISENKNDFTNKILILNIHYYIIIHFT